VVLLETLSHGVKRGKNLWTNIYIRLSADLCTMLTVPAIGIEARLSVSPYCKEALWTTANRSCDIATQSTQCTGLIIGLLSGYRSVWIKCVTRVIAQSAVNGHTTEQLTIDVFSAIRTHVP
jgi:hypothetical protein